MTTTKAYDNNGMWKVVVFMLFGWLWDGSDGFSIIGSSSMTRSTSHLWSMSDEDSSISSEKPKLILIAGCPGTDTSSFGMRVALDQGISNCMTTDMLRTMIKSTNVLNYGSDNVIDDWKESCRVLYTSDAIQELMDQALDDGNSLILFGDQVLPSNDLLDQWTSKGGIAMGCLLEIKDQEVHKSRLSKQPQKEHFENIRIIHDELIELAKNSNWLRIEQQQQQSTTVCDMVASVLEEQCMEEDESEDEEDYDTEAALEDEDEEEDFFEEDEDFDEEYEEEEEEEEAPTAAMEQQDPVYIAPMELTSSTGINNWLNTDKHVAGLKKAKPGKPATPSPVVESTTPQPPPQPRVQALSGNNFLNVDVHKTALKKAKPVGASPDPVPVPVQEQQPPVPTPASPPVQAMSGNNLLGVADVHMAGLKKAKPTTNVPAATPPAPAPVVGPSKVQATSGNTWTPMSSSKGIDTLLDRSEYTIQSHQEGRRDLNLLSIADKHVAGQVRAKPQSLSPPETVANVPPPPGKVEETPQPPKVEAPPKVEEKEEVKSPQVAPPSAKSPDTVATPPKKIEGKKNTTQPPKNQTKGFGNTPKKPTGVSPPKITQVSSTAPPKSSSPPEVSQAPKKTSGVSKPTISEVAPTKPTGVSPPKISQVSSTAPPKSSSPPEVSQAPKKASGVSKPTISEVASANPNGVSPPNMAEVVDRPKSPPKKKKKKPVVASTSESEQKPPSKKKKQIVKSKNKSEEEPENESPPPPPKPVDTEASPPPIKSEPITMKEDTLNMPSEPRFADIRAKMNPDSNLLNQAKKHFAGQVKANPRYSFSGDNYYVKSEEALKAQKLKKIREQMAKLDEKDSSED